MGESDRRRTRSQARLEAAGVPVNSSLPLVEDSSEVRLRAPSEVANRALCLAFVAAWASNELDNKVLLRWARREPFYDHLSPRERAFIAARKIGAEQRINMGWQIEAAVPLVWAIGARLRLGLSVSQHAPWAVLKVIPPLGKSTHRFVSSASLRTTKAILDEVDLIYRIHWAARNARLNGRPLPRGWEYGVIQERHRGLNWLSCYGDDTAGADWDRVATDT